MSELEAKTDTHAIAQELKQARESLDWSLDQVAEKLNLSIEQIEKLEQIEKNIADLTPFERGYLRNYANLLDLDISSYENTFPDGVGVASDLHSVERYSYKLAKPIFSRRWAKIVFYLLFLIVLLALISTVNFDLNI
jgi:cytoskeleton protein RodZ